MGRDLHDVGRIALGSPVVDLADGSSIGTVTRLLDPSVPSPLLQAKVIQVVAPVGWAQVCWFRTSPSAVAWARPAAQTAFGRTPVDVRRYHDRGPQTPLPADSFAHDSQRRLWLGGLAVISLSWVALSWTRRADFALYRALGASRAEILFMGQVEVGFAVLSGVLVGVGFGVAIQAFYWKVTLTGAMLGTALRPAINLGLFCLLLEPLVGVLFTTGHIHNRMRE